ncbi:MAG TPA: lytic transglycosylase domain-containing protein [Candidatus Acidoferrales bacterium]|nr:lytic transglycosylase domain-containing protein [Candidatus Acidoferrales bacterium]
MFHSVAVGYPGFFAAVALVCTVPNSLGFADLAVRSAATTQEDNPVRTLFTAVSRCAARLSERDRWRIAGVIHRESQRYGYDPLFILAMAEVESGCSPTARSEDGAVGLIQVRPATARAVADEAGMRWNGAEMLTDPFVNVQLGLRYLAQLEKRFHDPHLAIAAYNLGPKRVARMPAQRARTAVYVQKVLARYELLLVAGQALRPVPRLAGDGRSVPPSYTSAPNVVTVAGIQAGGCDARRHVHDFPEPSRPAAGS